MPVLPKSVKRVLQQVINTSALASPLPALLRHQQDSIFIHTLLLLAYLLFFLFVFLPPSLLPPLRCNVRPHRPLLFCALSTHPRLFPPPHACFSKTRFTLFCGPRRMWSQDIGKVSYTCATPTLHFTANTLCYTTLVLLLLLPIRSPNLWRRECICLTPTSLLLISASFVAEVLWLQYILLL